MIWWSFQTAGVVPGQQLTVCLPKENRNNSSVSNNNNNEDMHRINCEAEIQKSSSFGGVSSSSDTWGCIASICWTWSIFPPFSFSFTSCERVACCLLVWKNPPCNIRLTGCYLMAFISNVSRWESSEWVSKWDWIICNKQSSFSRTNSLIHWCECMPTYAGRSKSKQPLVL